MDQTLRGMTALVTGAAQGLGRAMALGLLESGMRVAILDRSHDTLQATADEFGSTFGAANVLALTADVADGDAVSNSVGQTLARFGTIDALVNNAGVGRAWIRPDFMFKSITFWEMTADQWRRFIDINTHGFYHMTHATLPHMMKRRSGRIITVTTSLENMVAAGSMGYGASKAAIEATMATLALDLAAAGFDGITANVIVPGGPANTPAMTVDESMREMLVQPQEMVAPLRYLLGAEGSTVTGRRFRANAWDPRLPARVAAELAGAPIAWPQLGGQLKLPDRWVETLAETGGPDPRSRG
jgi:NAD(P)-dependent dehydrogenase (short-subunit alcohol dehydrogenase family)